MEVTDRQAGNEPEHARPLRLRTDSAVCALLAFAASWMLAVCLPSFRAMYGDLGAFLPGPTQALIDVPDGAWRTLGLLLAGALVFKDRLLRPRHAAACNALALAVAVVVGCGLGVALMLPLGGGLIKSIK